MSTIGSHTGIQTQSDSIYLETFQIKKTTYSNNLFISINEGGPVFLLFVDMTFKSDFFKENKTKCVKIIASDGLKKLLKLIDDTKVLVLHSVINTNLFIYASILRTSSICMYKLYIYI